MTRIRISLLLSIISACWFYAAHANADPIPRGQFRVVAENDSYRFRVGSDVEPQLLLRYVNRHERGRTPVTMEDMRRMNAERGDWNRDGIGNLVYACGRHNANARRYSRSPGIWPTCPTGVHRYFVLVPQRELYWVPRRHAPDPAETLREDVAAAVRTAGPIDVARFMNWIRQWFQLMDPAYQPSAQPLAAAMTEIVNASRMVVPASPAVAVPATTAVVRTTAASRPSPGHRRAAVSPMTRPDPRVAWMGLAVILMAGFFLGMTIVCVAAVVSNRRMGKRLKQTLEEADDLSNWQRGVYNAYLKHIHRTVTGTMRDMRSDPLRVGEVDEIFRNASNVMEALHAPMPIAGESPERITMRDQMVRDFVASQQRQDAQKSKGGSQPGLVVDTKNNEIGRLKNKARLFDRLKSRYLKLYGGIKDLAARIRRYDEIVVRLCGTEGAEALATYAAQRSLPPASEVALESAAQQVERKRFEELEAVAERYRVAVDQWLGNGGEINAFEAWIQLRRSSASPSGQMSDTEWLNAILAKHIIPSFREYCERLVESVRQFVSEHQDLVRMKDCWNQTRLRTFLESANRLMAAARAIELVDSQLMAYLDKGPAGQHLLRERCPDNNLLYDLSAGILNAEQHRQQADDALVRSNEELGHALAAASASVASLQQAVHDCYATNADLVRVNEACERRETDQTSTIQDLNKKLSSSRQDTNTSVDRCRELAEIVRAYIRGMESMDQESAEGILDDFWMQFRVMRDTAERAFVLHPAQYGTIPPGTRPAFEEKSRTGQISTKRPPPPNPERDSAQSGARLIMASAGEFDANGASQDAAASEGPGFGDETTAVVRSFPPDAFDASHIPPTPAVPAFESIGDASVPEDEDPFPLRSDRLKP